MRGNADRVWKQACGDPQNGIGPVGDALMMQDCETGGDLPPNSGLRGSSAAPIRSRHPAEASRARPGPALTLTGTPEVPGCGLRFWIPGKVKPNVMTAGLASLNWVQFPGGRTVTGCADGECTVSTGV